MSNPNQPPMAPPPPPAPRTQGRRNKDAVGFQPSSPAKLIAELTLVTAIVVGAGAAAFVGAGAIAAWVTPWVPLKVDQTLGRVASANGDSACPKAEAYVTRLATPLLEAAGPLPFAFSFRVTDDPAVNAFALPGGFVTVHRGLLEAAQTGEEVAGVLAHEVEHALLRHGTRRMLREMGGGVLLNLLTGGLLDTGEARTISRVAGRLTSLSYDRDQEREADTEGMRLLLDAGIDPRGLQRFFLRLSESDHGAPLTLLSTHPDPGSRAEMARAAARGKSFRPLPPPPPDLCR